MSEISHISQVIKKRGDITPTEKFSLEDSLYKLGFSNGLSNRQKRISDFIEQYKGNLSRLGKWVVWLLENQDKVDNAGAYLRRVMSEPTAEPPL